MNYSQSQRSTRTPPEPVLRRNLSSAAAAERFSSDILVDNESTSAEQRRSTHLKQHSTIRPGMYRREGGFFVATQRSASEHEIIAVNPQFRTSSPDARVGKLSPEPKVRSRHSGSSKAEMALSELRTRPQNSLQLSPEPRVRSRHSGSNRHEMTLPELRSRPQNSEARQNHLWTESGHRHIHSSSSMGDVTQENKSFCRQISYTREDSSSSTASHVNPDNIFPATRPFSRSSMDAKSRDSESHSHRLTLKSAPSFLVSSEACAGALSKGTSETFSSPHPMDDGFSGGGCIERKTSGIGRSGSGKRLPPVLRERDRSLRKQQQLQPAILTDDNYSDIVVSDGDFTQNAPTWNTYLYQLQQQAPKPICIQCPYDVPNRPPQYGKEHHGSLSRQEAELLLQQGDGCYLVRKSERAPDAVSLAIRFEGETKNYKLFFDGTHYVGEKRFDTIHDLVADGLIHFFIELRAADYIQAMSQESNYEESPYMAYNMKRKRMGKGSKGDSSVNGSTAEALSAATLDEQAAPATDVSGYEKPHTFKVQNFIGLHWCDFCANFMWGLLAQGVKCQDCGVQAHKKCSERVPSDCMPDMKYIKRIYGGDLTTVVKANNRPVPCVVEKCVKEIEARGLEQEGLYRLAGFHDDVEAVRMAFDKDAENADVSPKRYDDINTVCSALKLYFRLLPIPLITLDVYNKVIEIVKQDLSDSEVVRQIKDPLLSLPPAHFHTLKFMCSHLSRVIQNQSKNMMSAENLAIVFAPTLMRSDNPNPMQSLIAVKYEQKLMERILHNHTQLLGKS